MAEFQAVVAPCRPLKGEATQCSWGPWTPGRAHCRPREMVIAAMKLEDTYSLEGKL